MWRTLYAIDYSTAQLNTKLLISIAIRVLLFWIHIKHNLILIKLFLCRFDNHLTLRLWDLYPKRNIKPQLKRHKNCSKITLFQKYYPTIENVKRSALVRLCSEHKILTIVTTEYWDRKRTVTFLEKNSSNSKTKQNPILVASTQW